MSHRGREILRTAKLVGHEKFDRLDEADFSLCIRDFVNNAIGVKHPRDPRWIDSMAVTPILRDLVRGARKN